MANWGAYGSKPASWGASIAAAQKLKPAPRPKTPATAPTATPAVAAAGSGGLPIDPSYDATIGGLQRKRDDTLAQYAGQRPRVLADYGYTAQGYDSSGAPTGLAFDPNNPFSRAALAKRTYDQTQAGTQNSMAARGQLYSGAREQAVAGNEFRYQQGSDALLKALTNALVGVAQGERGAKTDYELGAGQAFGDRISRASQTQPEPPPPAPAAAAPAAASKTRLPAAKAPSKAAVKGLSKAGAKQRKKYS